MAVNQLHKLFILYSSVKQQSFIYEKFYDKYEVTSIPVNF